ncbi:MAG: methionyl-tRNA formyltransferase [Acidimicrobiaceae bacterium]|nr:methionyl-tRNA formyltransferase [Acidimicrobiaceae bacterium]
MIRKIAFLGTPQISTSTLAYLVDAGYEIPVVVTGEDKKRGRGSALTPSPVKVLARELGIEVSHDPKILLDKEFDLAVVVAYGKLISDALLDKGLFINLHFSLLPRWRGAAPMERAILAGDPETGICVMKLVSELDAGPIYQTRKMPLNSVMTLEELSKALSQLANEALGSELSMGEEAFARATDQIGEPTYAHKLTVENLRIDWEKTSDEVLRKIRLGRAWTTLEGSRFKIFAASQSPDNLLVLSPGQISGAAVGTGLGIVELQSVQPENKRVMSAKDWTNGTKNAQGLRFI